MLQHGPHLEDGAQDGHQRGGHSRQPCQHSVAAEAICMLQDLLRSSLLQRGSGSVCVVLCKPQTFLSMCTYRKPVECRG